jgi:hypothetical protein
MSALVIEMTSTESLDPWPRLVNPAGASRYLEPFAVSRFLQAQSLAAAIMALSATELPTAARALACDDCGDALAGKCR